MRLLRRVLLLPLLALATLPFFPARAESALDAPPIRITRLSLHLKDVSPEEAFAEFARVARVRFVGVPETLWDSPRLKKTVSIDATNKPFGEVLRDLCAATDLIPGNRIVSGRLSLSLLEKSDLPRPRFAAGPAFAWLDRAVHTSLISYVDSGEPRSQWRLGFTVLKDPSLHVDKVSTAVIEAVDENGRSLLTPETAESVVWTYDEEDMDRTVGFPCQFAINAPANTGRRLARFKGEVYFHTLDATATWTIPDVAKEDPATAKVDDLTFTFKRLAYRNGHDEEPVVWFFVTYPKVPVSPPPLTLNSARLVDDRGQEYVGYYSLTLTATKGDGPATFQYSFGFEAPAGKTMGTPQKFTLSMPKLRKSFTLPIELTDFPDNGGQAAPAPTRPAK